MMDIKLILFLLFFLLIARTANAVEIYNKNKSKLYLYGRIDGLRYVSNSKELDIDQTYMHLKLKGETNINDQLTGYGQWEYQVQGNNEEEKNNQSWTSIVFAGIKFGNSGFLDYGRNYGVIYNVTSWTDVLPRFSGGTYSTDNFQQSRAKGVITYRNQGFFNLIKGLNFAIQYQGKNNSLSNDTGNNNVFKQNGDGYGASLIYNFNKNCSVGGAMVSSKRTANQNSASVYGKGRYAKVYSSGIKYDDNNIYLAIQYSQTYNATQLGILSIIGNHSKIYGFANKAQNFEIVTQYQFNFGLRPSIAYLQSKVKDVENYGNQDIVKYFDLGATYFFNRDISTYVDYKINLIKNKNNFTHIAGISTDNILALGLVYQF